MPRAVDKKVEEIKILNEPIFISETLSLTIRQQIDSIVSLAALMDYEVKIERNKRRLEITYINKEQESKKYQLYLFITPGRVLSSTYLFNEYGINFHSKDIGLLGPIEKLKELL